MEHGARQDTTRVIAVGFICLGTLFTLSLATNIIQGINNYRLQTEQKVAVTPMLFSAPFAVSQNQADASYIEQLGLSFIALRLNVTPETVDAQHQQLLRYVLPASRRVSRRHLPNADCPPDHLWFFVLHCTGDLPIPSAPMAVRPG